MPTLPQSNSGPGYQNKPQRGTAKSQLNLLLRMLVIHSLSFRNTAFTYAALCSASKPAAARAMLYPNRRKLKLVILNGDHL